MKVGDIEARPGTKAFGYLRTAPSRSGLCPDIPIHVVAGAGSGPTLLVQAAIHGTEVVATVAILHFVRKVDPQCLRGTVIAVPVVNRVGFELGERGSRIDGKDISQLFPGNPRGSVSEQVAHVYFHEVVARANAMIDF
ncbi:MAG: succinylglutamate desuccinylase/aspartoacylase family protein, partial [Armatimonadota bacterium]|nr:succinylglutamate desuccinylase/aspartoacylase family protein [Armatimonadota bacterium]